MRHLLGIGVLILVVIMFLYSCKSEPKKVVTTNPITFTKEGELSILRGERDSLIARLDIEIADSDYETQTGLMYRDALGQNQGMLFVFPDVAMHSFYMKNTKIPLDILFVDETLKIVSLAKNAVPFDESGLSSEVPVQYVLEVNAGLADEWGILPGDRIQYEAY